MRHDKRFRKARLALGAVVAIAGLVLTACAGNAQSNDPHHITIALGEEPRSLASWNAYAAAGHVVLRNIQEALLNRDPETNELVGELATSWEQVDDTTWHFTLREGVSFTDGTPFNAETAADGLNYVLSPENAFAMRVFLGPDVTAEAVDEYTLALKTATPDPILPDRMYYVTIPSYAAIEDDPDAYDTTPVGTGPYTLERWDRGQRIELVANEEWWGRDDEQAALGDNESVTSATYVFRPETQVRAGLISSGEADLARWVTQDQCESAPNCVYDTGVETIHLRLDTPNPLLGDVRVREAISLALDRDALLNQILGGGEVAAQLVGPSATGFNPALTVTEPDLDAAKALIEEAAADGVDLSTPLRVVTREGNILRSNEAIQLIADTLTSIGLTAVTSETVESASFEEQWAAGYPQIPADRGWVALQMHGNELLDYSASFGMFFTCDAALSAFCDDKVEAPYIAATEAIGETRESQLQALAQTAYDTYADLPIGQPNFYYALSDKVDWQPRVDGFQLLKEMTLAPSK